MTAKSKIANAKHGSRTSRNTENAPMSLNKNQQKQFNMVCERIASGLSGTKESELGFPFGLAGASQADAYRNILHRLR